MLYRPRFFHEVIFDSVLADLTKYNDDIAFRLASLVKGTHIFLGKNNILEPPECTSENQLVSDSGVAARRLEAISIGARAPVGTISYLSLDLFLFRLLLSV